MLVAIFCDASHQAVGAALQQQAEENWQPFVYLSKKLNISEIKHFMQVIELIMNIPF